MRATLLRINAPSFLSEGYSCARTVSVFQTSAPSHHPRDGLVRRQKNQISIGARRQHTFGAVQTDPFRWIESRHLQRCGQRYAKRNHMLERAVQCQRAARQPTLGIAAEDRKSVV